ncbi:GyrI-like domain-containing protein [Bacteroidota bacterium]
MDLQNQQVFPGIIKIVQLLPMRVVSFYQKNSETPEIDAWSKLKNWADPLGLLENPTKHQVYGFNNPIPLKETKLRGYEFWITIPDDFKVGDEVITKNFIGGLYAVVRIKDVRNIGDVCIKLYQWIQNNENFQLGYPPDYDFENSPSLELEHHIVPHVTEEKDILIDYYLPIIEKK